MRHVLGRLVGRVSVLAVAGLAVVVDHLPERDHLGPEALGLEVVEGLARHAHQPLEEVAVRQGPLAPALAAEEAEELPGFVAQTDLPGDVVVAADRVLGVEALPRPDGVGRVDEVGPRTEEPLDLGEVLRAAWPARAAWARRPCTPGRPATARRRSASRRAASRCSPGPSSSRRGTCPGSCRAGRPRSRGPGSAGSRRPGPRCRRTRGWPGGCRDGGSRSRLRSSRRG